MGQIHLEWRLAHSAPMKPWAWISTAREYKQVDCEVHTEPNTKRPFNINQSIILNKHRTRTPFGWNFYNNYDCIQMQ